MVYTPIAMTPHGWWIHGLLEVSSFSLYPGSSSSLTVDGVMSVISSEGRPELRVGLKMVK